MNLDRPFIAIAQVMVAQQLISVVQSLDNYHLLVEYLLFVPNYILLTAFTVVLFLCHIVSRCVGANLHALRLIYFVCFLRSSNV